MIPKIFISYRRVDSRKDAGRIYDRLVQAFPKDNVFKDVDDIPPGVDFRSVLAKAVVESDVMLVMIGKQWVDVRDAQGSRRLDDPEDFVRIEVESGLLHDSCKVIPVLVDNASMPSPEELPESLRPMAFINAFPIRDDPDFNRDVSRLIVHLGGAAEERRLILSAIQRYAIVLVMAVALLVGAVVLYGSKGGSVAPSPAPSALPLSAVEYNERGLAALKELDYTNAIRDFKAAIEVDPQYAAAYFNLGVAYEEEGNLEEAQIAYKSALENDSQLLLARYRLSELLLDDGQVEEGFQVIDEGLRILKLGDVGVEGQARDQLFFMMYTTRGRAYYLKGSTTDFSLAVDDLKQAIARKTAVPYPAPAYYFLALVYEAQGDTEAAQQAWLDVLATHDPNNSRHREWAAQARTAISN